MVSVHRFPGGLGKAICSSLAASEQLLKTKPIGFRETLIMKYKIN
jgi:hypothetical protein